MTDIAGVARRFDEMLRNMAGQAGSLEALLGVFFSFLHKNTDFYVTYDPAKTVKAGMGFPVGKAEQLLIKAFRSFPFKPYDERQSQAPRLETGGSSIKTKASSRILPTTKPSIDDTRGRPGESNLSSTQGPAVEKIEPRVAVTTIPDPRKPPPRPELSPLSSNSMNPDETPPTSVPGSDTPDSGAAPGGVRVRYTKDGKQVPIGNGGVTPVYYWTQTIGEATVYVDVPPGTRSKDVSCIIQPRRLKLAVRGAGSAAGGAAAASVATGVSGTDVLIEGELPSAVSREDSMWSLIDAKVLVISFEKATRSWWKSVVEGDPEIDTTQVDSTARIGEFDEETQATIRKIMFDQRQKALGLPTSDELSADAIFEKAKNLPGSPFLPGGALSGESAAPGGGGGCLGPDGEERDLDT